MNSFQMSKHNHQKLADKNAFVLAALERYHCDQKYRLEQIKYVHFVRFFVAVKHVAFKLCGFADFSSFFGWNNFFLTHLSNKLSNKYRIFWFQSLYFHITSMNSKRQLKSSLFYLLSSNMIHLNYYIIARFVPIINYFHLEKYRPWKNRNYVFWEKLVPHCKKQPHKMKELK